jgi:hypothetical protein
MYATAHYTGAPASLPQLVWASSARYADCPTRVLGVPGLSAFSSALLPPGIGINGEPLRADLPQRFIVASPDRGGSTYTMDSIARALAGQSLADSWEEAEAGFSEDTAVAQYKRLLQSGYSPRVVPLRRGSARYRLEIPDPAGPGFVPIPLYSLHEVAQVCRASSYLPIRPPVNPTLRRRAGQLVAQAWLEGVC